jgi:hypothetical protein
MVLGFYSEVTSEGFKRFVWGLRSEREENQS